jgi:raffinose/stachyose/melibiose transport system permease protein
MKRYGLRTGGLEVVMVLVALAFLFPIYILVNLAIRPETDLSSPLAPTIDPTFANFGTAWVQAGLGGAIVNSAIITIVSVVLIVAFSSLAAYGIVRATSRWGSVAFYGFMIGLLVPFQLGLIPLYTTMKNLGLLGTLLPLIIIYIGMRMPFSIFLYAQFMRSVPIDYEEAASLDGAGPIRSFVQVVFPLVRPATGTVVILNGLFAWNDFLTPLLYLSGSGNQTIPVAIYTFVGEYFTQWPLVFASLIIGALPVLVAFFFIQRSLIQGLASGVKG